MRSGDTSVLTVRLAGPAVQRGRISLRQLAVLAKELQQGVERTARLLVSREGGRNYSPTAKQIREAAGLDLVGLHPGSVVLALDRHTRQPQLEGMDLGEAALEQFFEVLDRIGSGQPTSLDAFDTRVLQSWKRIGTILKRGVTSVEFRLSTKGEVKAFHLDRDLARRVIDRVENSAGNFIVVEGRLVMGDFKEGAFRCRIHPPTGRPVVCEFDEALADTVYSLLRSYVRAWGKGELDPATGLPTKLQLQAIAPAHGRSAPAALGEPVGWNEFWEEKSLDELAEKQGIGPAYSFNAFFGRGRDLWESDAELEAFVREIYERRAEDALSILTASEETEDDQNPCT